MKLRTYLALLRPRSFAGRLAIAAVLCLAFHHLAPGAERRAGARAFVALTLVAPYLVGRELSRVLHPVLHRPFGLLLPHLRATLLHWHLPLLVLLAAASALVVRARDTTLAWPVSASVALAGLCLLLPLENPGRWFGSRWAAGVITGGVLLAAFEGAALRGLMQASPWITALSALAVAAACCQMGFARRRLRVRAQVPLFELADAFDPAAQRDVARQQLSHSRHQGQPWPIRTVGRSTTDWIRVVLHECLGFRGGWRRQLALIALVAPISVAAGVFASRLFDSPGRALPFGELLYQAIWATPPHAPQEGRFAFLLTLPIFLVGLGGALPRPGQLYPISRERRGRLVFAVSVLQEGVQFPLVLASLAALAWVGAQVTGVAFDATVVPNCLAANLLVLPLLPWLMWLRFRSQLQAGLSLWVLLGPILVFPIACVIGTHGRAWLVSVAGGATVALITLAGLALYRAAVLRFYRRGDLLPAPNPGVVFRLV